MTTQEEARQAAEAAIAALAPEASEFASLDAAGFGEATASVMMRAARHPLDLAAADRDTYLVAGITDHICPWQSCYRSTQLLGGRHRFVLSTSGHVAAMVNPPGNDKARYQMARQCPEDPQEWLRRAETRHGSWWPDYWASPGEAGSRSSSR